MAIWYVGIFQKNFYSCLLNHGKYLTFDIYESLIQNFVNIGVLLKFISIS